MNFTVIIAVTGDITCLRGNRNGSGSLTVRGGLTSGAAAGIGDTQCIITGLQIREATGSIAGIPG